MNCPYDLRVSRDSDSDEWLPCEVCNPSMICFYTEYE